MMVESKEDILNIFTGFNKEFIFNVLFFITWIFNSDHECNLFRSGSCIGYLDFSLFDGLLEISLDSLVNVEISLSCEPWNLLFNFFVRLSLKFNTELREIFVEIFF